MLRHGCVCVFFFKQKTSYEMRISDWISDVCSSDLYGINLTLNVNWERPAGSMIAGYRTEYRINGAEWVPISSRTSLTSIEIVNPQFGTWDFRITPLDRMVRTSEPVVVSIVVHEILQPG